MPRLVRRAPLSERVKAYLDPYDWLLWLSEELNDDVFEEWLKLWAIPIGVGANVVFVLARGASRSDATEAYDVFGEETGRRSGWFVWLAALLVHSLTLLCCANALYTFLRKRKYRLFERAIDETLASPSARRVPVQSSGERSTPLKFLRDTIISNSPFPKPTASQTATPGVREVWELQVWDPRAANLSLFAMFSPGHVLFYYVLLPPKPTDPRPSVTIATAFFFGAILSLQLSLLQVAFTRQGKDKTLIHGQVMNEYDTKFVRPILNRPVRNVGTQTTQSTGTSAGSGHALTPFKSRTREVDVYTPTTIVNRGFHVNPNPDYAQDLRSRTSS